MSRAVQLRRRVVGVLHTHLVRHGVAVLRVRNEVAQAFSHLGVKQVIDGGANVGQFATGLRSSGFSGTIVSVEPSSSAYATLARHAERDPMWSPVRAALGAAPGSADLQVSKDLVSSSLLARTTEQVETFPRSVPSSVEQVAVTSIDTLVEEFGLDVEQLGVKLDLQGYEGVALDGAVNTVGMCPVIILEMSFVHLYDDQELWADLHARMSAAGYIPWNFIPGWVDRATGRMSWCDGVYVRADLAADRGARP